MVVLNIPSAALILLTLLLPLQALALSPDPSGASKVGNGQHQSSIGSQCLSSLDCGANGNTACCAVLPQGSQTIGICSGCGASTQQGKQGCGFGDQGKSLSGDPQVCAASATTEATGAAAAAGASNSGAASAASGAAAAAAAAGSSSASTNAASSGCSTQRRRPGGRSAKNEQRRQAAASQQPPVLEPQPSQIPDPSLNAGKGNQQNQQFVTGACVNSKDCGAQQSNLANVCCASVVDKSTGQTVGVCSGSAVGNASPKLGCGFGDGKANSAA